MKKYSLILLLVVIALSFMNTAAFAKAAQSSGTSSSGDFAVDASIGFATGPGAFDQGFGTNFGAGYTLRALDKNLQARIDLSYFDFSYSYLNNDLSYTRVPLTISARYYFPIRERLRAFAQAGIETSFDSYDYADIFGKHSKNEVNLGLSPGGGIDFFVVPNVSIFAVGRWHVISDSYFSMQFGGAFHF